VLEANLAATANQCCLCCNHALTQHTAHLHCQLAPQEQVVQVLLYLQVAPLVVHHPLNPAWQPAWPEQPLEAPGAGQPPG
jgi:hypothetical protein